MSGHPPVGVNDICLLVASQPSLLDLGISRYLRFNRLCHLHNRTLNLPMRVITSRQAYTVGIADYFEVLKAHLHMATRVAPEDWGKTSKDD